MIQQLRFWAYAKRIGSRVLKKYLYTHVHSIIHHDWNKEAIQISIDGWTDEQNVVYTHKGRIFYLKTKEILKKKKKLRKFWHVLQHRWALRTLH